MTRQRTTSTNHIRRETHWDNDNDVEDGLYQNENGKTTIANNNNNNVYDEDDEVDDDDEDDDDANHQQ